MNKVLYAGVVIDLPIPAADKIFHYRVPANLRDILRLGDRILVPFGAQKVAGYVVKLVGETEVANVKDIINIIASELLTEKAIKWAFWLAERYNCYLSEALHCFLPPGGGQPIKSRKESFVSLVSGVAEKKEMIGNLRRRAPKQAAVIETLIKTGKHIAVKDVLKAAHASAGSLKGLQKKGLIRVEEYEQQGPSVVEQAMFNSPPPEKLTREQKNAFDVINVALARTKTRKNCFLLYGVTGSGKTEVYLRLISENQRRGKGAIVLVPEIALTPQTVALFNSRFGTEVAVLHSRLSLGERYREWWRIRRGEASIVVGTRSAVFAPIASLGLIIIDEEHETSYKQEANPRYHARDVAFFRAKEEGAVFLLGSATPSVESYYRAAVGEYMLLKLPKRVAGRSLPKVELVDMRRELKEGNRSIFSRKLARGVGDNP